MADSSESADDRSKTGNPAAVSERHTGTVHERLATLEERTSPKPKTKVELIKEWGGVATLLIAIGYTFPTENYFRPQKKEVEDLRAVIEQTTMILADGLKTAASLEGNKQIGEQVNRYYTTRAYLMMERHSPALKKNAAALTPTELLVVGMNFAMVNRPDEALYFYGKATDVAGKGRGKGDIPAEFVVPFLQASRMKGQILFMPGAKQDILLGRKAFQEALSAGMGAKSIQEMSSLLDIQGNWAFLELTFGDWLCGQGLLAQANETYLKSGLNTTDMGQLQVSLNSTAAVKMKPNQSNKGCD